MRREDCVELFQRIPEILHPQVNLILRNQFVVSVEMVARFEPTYLVARGREGGTSDEGRAFFVPYEEISYVRIEKVVRFGELKMMYGETGYQDLDDRLAEQSEKSGQAGRRTDSQTATPAPIPSPLPAAVAPTDPGSIARQNLLDRIRATRANVAGATGKLSGGK